MKDSRIKQLARQIQKNPGDSFSKFALALEFRKQGKLKKTRILFEDILTTDPGYVGVYYHLGKLYETLDRLEDARRIYEQGIPVAEERGEVRTKNELREALTQLEMIIEDSTG